MITNERQHGITKRRISEFQAALATSEPIDGVDPVLHEAVLASYRWQIEQMEQELARYDALKRGEIAHAEFTSLRDLPIALIEARIASGLNQAQLADRLNLAEQQIQRYEKNLYAGANLDRLQAVADALNVRIVEHVEYGVVAG